MLKKLKILFLLSAIIILAKAQQKPYTKFTDKITVRGKVIYKAQMIGIQNENFSYVVCEDGDFVHERHCNVNIQKEDQKRSCSVHITVNDPEKERLADLFFYPFADDKVIITWANKIDYFKWKSNQFKILDISTCELVDVALPDFQVSYIVVYKNAADIGFQNETYCGSTENCKISVDTDGKLISGPTKILSGVDIDFLEPLGSVNQNAPDQGFYAAVASHDKFTFHRKFNHHLYKINGQGKSVKFMTVKEANYARASTSHNLFTFCHTLGEINTTIACMQFDQSLKLKLNKSIEFEDGKLQRWLQPYNLKKGGLLLVTGRASDVEGKRYNTFSMIKIHEDGQTDEAVEFDNLNFTCSWIKSLYVNVLEKESGEICAHFSCTYEDKEQKINTLQLALKCLSKA